MPKAGKSGSDSNTTPSDHTGPLTTTAYQSAPIVRTEPGPVERGFSVVRRKLLLKNRGPQDAQGLYARAVKAYSYGDYLESLDLAWAAVQLDSQDARFWFARAMSERALGDGESARASARRGAALDFLTRNDSVRMLDHVSTADQGFLREASAGLTRESARRIAAGSAPLESLARTVNSNSSSDSRELAHKVP
jgi:hypothetical protein